jgi:deoxyribodipyrimidine photo-lyase
VARRNQQSSRGIYSLILSPRLADTEEQILSRFVYTQSRASQLGLVDPLNPGAEPSDKHSRLMAYADGRDRADRDTSSRLSPYLASGVISIRECVREVMKANGRKKGVDGGRETGPGRWVQELAWRDFYVHILAAFPRLDRSTDRPSSTHFHAECPWDAHFSRNSTT